MEASYYDMLVRTLVVGRVASNEVQHVETIAKGENNLDYADDCGSTVILESLINEKKGVE